MKKIVSVILTFCLLWQVVAVNGVFALNVDTDSELVTTSAEARWLKASGSIKTAKTKNSFNISWSKVTGASQYEVYRRTGSGKWTCIKAVRSTKFTDTTVKKGKSYTYKVRAISGSNSKSLFKTGKKIKL